MEIIDNINRFLGDDLKRNICQKAKLKAVAPATARFVKPS
jgi:hypothetical protein